MAAGHQSKCLPTARQHTCTLCPPSPAFGPLNFGSVPSCAQLFRFAPIIIVIYSRFVPTESGVHNRTHGRTQERVRFNLSASVDVSTGIVQGLVTV